jgi:hypothetical protein
VQSCCNQTVFIAMSYRCRIRVKLIPHVTAQLRWCNSGSRGKLGGNSVRRAFLSGNIREVVPFAARGLKRQKFLSNVAVYCISR